MKPIYRRNQLATIQRVTLTRTGLSSSEAWTNLGTEFVSVEPLTAAEIQQGGQMAGTLGAAVVMPFRQGLSVKDRIVIDNADGTRTFEIQSVQNPTAMREEMRCVCVERQA